MSRLPQELIDDIIDYVDFLYKGPLRACSLVCKRWSIRSRKRLFEQVKLSSQADLERWCAHVSPGPSGPSSLVEDLSLRDTRSSMALLSGVPWATSSNLSWLQLSVLSKAALHLQSFSRLRTLKIVGWDALAVPVSLMLHCLGPPSENVTRLTLQRISIRASALVTFISQFPHLHDLSIDTIKRPWEAYGTGDLHQESHDRIVPTHPRGEFSVPNMRFDEPEKVFGGIALLEPQFCRITFKSVKCDLWRSFWPVVEACAGSLEELEIEPTMIDADCDGLSLACCPNLRTVKFDTFTSHDHPPPSYQFMEKCLSTITSTKLSEVTIEAFGYGGYTESPGSELPSWDSLDTILYNLAGQYRPRYEGDKMLVKYESRDLRDTDNFLWRLRERRILRHKEFPTFL